MSNKTTDDLTPVEPGYYWIRHNDGGVETGPEIAYWTGKGWVVMGAHALAGPHFQPIQRIALPSENQP